MGKQSKHVNHSVKSIPKELLGLTWNTRQASSIFCTPAMFFMHHCTPSMLKKQFPRKPFWWGRKEKPYLNKQIKQVEKEPSNQSIF